MDGEDNDYTGPAMLRTEDTAIAVEVVLRGHFQPIDGRFHWYGRIAANPEVDALTGGRSARVVLSTDDGDALGTLSDPDPWSRHRISGVGRPPFAVPTSLRDLDPTNPQ